ncbi:50S ribosomal protein L11 methyltransferase [Crocinitomix catalasitica]|nr:50S ribosomal protein L11 methyltransferase [Crocinitomix catalasitica]
MDYYEINITLIELHPWREIAISILDQKNFESFIETKTGLKGYIPKDQFRDQFLSEIEAWESCEKWTKVLIEDRNWNEVWESQYDPVLINDKLAIIAPFHMGEFDQKLKIIIQPQMSFGTGHHQTTYLASRRLSDLDLVDKKVLDMGTGTGVLAIVAEKLGAAFVYAVDIDKWAVENALQNAELNNCQKIEMALGGHELLEGMKFDLLIANINKNILIEHFSVYSKVLNLGGKLLISGFFETDKNELVDQAKLNNFEFIGYFVKDEWALIEFDRSRQQGGQKLTIDP